MKADILAGLIQAQQQAPQTSAELGHHTGVVLTWDELTGANTIEIGGNTFTNLKVLTAGPGVLFTPGDVVSLLRVQTVYYVLGRVAAPGAGAALGTRQAFVETIETTTSAAWTNLATFGPQLSSVYVSSAKRVLVFLTTQSACGNAYALASVEVTGASTITADVVANLTVNGTFDPTLASSANATTHQSNSTGVRVLTAADGLTSGMHTFTVKYRRESLPGWTANTASFAQRRLVVMPF